MPLTVQACGRVAAAVANGSSADCQWNSDTNCHSQRQIPELFGRKTTVMRAGLGVRAQIGSLLLVGAAAQTKVKLLGMKRAPNS